MPRAHAAFSRSRTLHWGSKGALDAPFQVTRMCSHLLTNGNVVYADLKPANVLVDPSGSGGLCLCDYGALARVGSSEAACTYPPPDYPRGTAIPATERTLLHGLGAMLVCFIAGTHERKLRYVSHSNEPNELLATAAIATGCADALAAVRRRSKTAAQVLALAWHGCETLAEFERLLRLTVEGP
jgi:serine/threonine protein kinase